MAFTPMIQQYLAVKKEYEDAFLFFRLGDFYEMFFEDAKKAAEELEITLTSRDGGVTERIPMCGVPYHAADQYIKRLIEKGYKVAICEQVEDPKQAKGVVKREVIQVITPGTVMTNDALRPKENNYIAAFSDGQGPLGVAFVDMSTGESKVTTADSMAEAIQEVNAHGCREVVTAPDQDSEVRQAMNIMARVTVSVEEKNTPPEPLAHLGNDLSVQEESQAFGRLLTYLYQTQKRSLDHLQAPTAYTVQDFMILNAQTKRNLELTSTIRADKKQGSLLWLIDRTMTAMGGRRLKQWLEKPLVNRKAIEDRHASVETLINHFFEREAIREALRGIYDLERLVGRVSFGNVNARELIQLQHSLDKVPDVIKVMEAIDHPILQAIAADLDPCTDIRDLIEGAIIQDPPISVTDGGIIRDGYDERLDEYRYASKNGKAWLTELEKSEREATGIKSLKIGYNKVFGYYIEVTKANLKLLPEGRYERKQTLANAERFITPELKEKERLITEAEEKMVDLEYDIFQTIREQIKAHGERLQKLARHISTIDVLQGFATVSDENRYVRPEFTEQREIALINSRHPVVEKVLTASGFVENDIRMNETCDVLLITGPNMGGKSTYMRQMALAAVMAQIGCFVAADQARLPIFDRIYTRIGATDDLVAGQSTFMVEMTEAQEAITHATAKSLILFDEIGRGTSTYDGIAIARAIVEYLHDRVGAKTLFSTHYHELTELEASLPRLKNVHVGVMEEDGRVVFLHKVMDGQADKSYGIHVAELAALPAALIERAAAILAELEAETGRDVKPIADTKGSVSEQLSFFPDEAPVQKQPAKTNREEEAVIQRLRALDLLNMTPMDAMNQLFDMHQKLKNS